MKDLLLYASLLNQHVLFSLGIFYTAAIIGPAAGYLLGGFFLNIYTEIGQM